MNEFIEHKGLVIIYGKIIFQKYFVNIFSELLLRKINVLEIIHMVDF